MERDMQPIFDALETCKDDFMSWLDIRHAEHNRHADATDKECVYRAAASMARDAASAKSALERYGYKAALSLSEYVIATECAIRAVRIHRLSGV